MNTQQRLVSLEREGEVAVIRVDNPPLNILNAPLRAALLETLRALGAHSGLRALLVECAGKTFFSGADIGEFEGPPREAEFRELFDALERLPFPVIAALHGTVLGGGLELALACHYRIATADTRCGFPEITLGVIPGAGGTQRMPRLIGVQRTVELLLSGKPVGAARALELGFIDEIIEPPLHESALAYVRRLLSRDAAARRTCELGVDPASGTTVILERLRSEALEQYPGRRTPLLAIEAVAASLRVPFAQGLAYEEQLANEAKASVECRAAVHLFFAERAARRVADLPEGTPARPVSSCAVIGAGTMGRGIAQCFANAGIPVTLLDADEAALERGLAAIRASYAALVARGRLSLSEQQTRLALIRGTLDETPLAAADLLIEAVFEDLALKRRVFAQLDRVARPAAVLATNTSTLDIEQIARATQRPSQVIGMHFFTPAQIMPLLEVVRGPSTSAETIQTVMSLAPRLRKVPVLARSCYGFIGNRMMEGYAREAERMVLEGATPRQVDGALERWGMAMGILAVFDMAGIDVSVNVHRANRERYPPDPSYYQADFALVEAGRLGRKSGRGYYRYAEADAAPGAAGAAGAQRQDDPEALAILAARARELRIEPRKIDDGEIVERCLYPLMNEGFRILEEGIAQRSGDIDVVWAAGYGFPRHRGGPMFYAETLGLRRLLEGLRRYRERYGAMHWEPAPLLVELVDSGMSLSEWERSARGGGARRGAPAQTPERAAAAGKPPV